VSEIFVPKIENLIIVLQITVSDIEVFHFILEHISHVLFSQVVQKQTLDNVEN